MHTALLNGEGSEKDKEHYAMLREQIRSMAAIEVYCMETGKIFKVGNYVTENLEFKAMERAAKARKGIIYGGISPLYH